MKNHFPFNLILVLFLLSPLYSQEACISHTQNISTIETALPIQLNTDKSCLSGVFSSKISQEFYQIEPLSEPVLISLSMHSPHAKDAKVALVEIQRNKKGQTSGYRTLWNSNTVNQKEIILLPSRDTYYLVAYGIADTNASYQADINITHKDAIGLESIEKRQDPFFVRTEITKKWQKFLWQPTQSGHYRLEAWSPTERFKFAIYQPKGDKSTEMQTAYDWHENGYALMRHIKVDSNQTYELWFGQRYDKKRPVYCKVAKETDVGKYDEPEPHNTIETALPFQEPFHAYGTLRSDSEKGDTDIWQFTVPEDAKGYRSSLSVTYKGTSADIALYNNQKKKLSSIRRGNEVVLDNLNIKPGTYYIKLYSRNQDNFPYDITWEKGEKLTDSMEREPNDKPEQAMPLPPKRLVKGMLSRYSTDDDYYRFKVKGEPHWWRIFAVGKGINWISISHYPRGGEILSNRSQGNRRVKLDKLILMPGEYLIKIDGSNGKYMLRAMDLGDAPQKALAELKTKIAQERQAQMRRNDPYAMVRKRLDAKYEQEPNNDTFSAQRIVLGSYIYGEVDNNGIDHYRFRLDQKQFVKIHIANHGIGHIDHYYIRAGSYTIERGNIDPNTSYDKIFHLNPGEYDISLRARFAENKDINYTVGVEFVSLFDDNISIAPKTSPLQVELSKSDTPLAAYSPWGQRVHHTVTLTNRSSDRQDIKLRLRTSERQITVSPSEINLSIEPHATHTLSLDLNAASNLSRLETIWLETVAEHNGNIIAHGIVDITPRIDVLPAQPFTYIPIDQTIAGGDIVSDKRNGTDIVAKSERDKEETFRMIDGIVATYNLVTGFYPPKEPFPYLVLDDNTSFNGLILYPDFYMDEHRHMQNFALEVSDDAKSWKMVAEGKMYNLYTPKGVPLSGTIKSKYVRIVPKSFYAANRDDFLRIAEFQLIDTNNRHKQIDIAKDEWGGHIVYAIPHHGELYRITQKSTHYESVRLRDLNETESILAFKNNRAALIEKIVLQQVSQKQIEAGNATTFVGIDFAMESAVGPWKKVWENNLTKEANGRTEITFDTPKWARFVRIRQQSGTDHLVRMGDFSVYEAENNESYRSVTGAWGYFSQNAAYELNHPSFPTQEGNLSILHTTPQNAISAEENRTVSGTVLRKQKNDWYRFNMKDGRNRLYVTLYNTPILSVSATIYDDNLTQLACTKRKEGKQHVRYECPIEASGTYFVNIEDMKRHILFTWDTSGSTSTMHNMLFHTISNISTKLDPDFADINLLPFGAKSPLLQHFSSDKLTILKAISDSRGHYDSSSSPGALLPAMKALANIEGAKTLLHITDAATDTGALTDAWLAYAEVQPSMICLALSSDGALVPNPIVEKRYMMDWCSAPGDHYAYIGHSPFELEKGLDRIWRTIQRPSSYSLHLTSDTVNDKPGSLKVERKKVKSQEKMVIPSLSVEMILDASGSMLKRIKGKRRIDIAKSVLKHLASSQIAAGTPVALRVFGHKKSGSCHTDLVVPLSPLKPKKFKKQLSALSAKNGAKTPIAASLRAVRGDLKQAKGKKLIILVTDGKETCDGDPEKEIRALQDDGYDIRLNIVGFAINDQTLSETFKKWAKAGNGNYFEAKNESSLHKALQKALEVPYKLYDHQGKLVHTGVAGESPLQLKPGIYKLVPDNPSMKSQTLTIFPEKQTNVSY